jgi:hypothetical protein
MIDLEKLNTAHLAPNRRQALVRMLAKTDASNRWRGKLPVPEKCHPLVREFFLLMNEQLATMKEVSDRAGISYQTISGWRIRRSPGLTVLIAALNVLGYGLQIVKLNDE